MTKKKMLTRNAILEVDDLGLEELEIPEWGGYIMVSGISAKQRDILESSILKSQNSQNVNIEDLRAQLVCMTARDEEGTLLFNAKKDLNEVNKKSSRAIDRIFAKAQKMSGMTKEDVDELTKN